MYATPFIGLCSTSVQHAKAVTYPSIFTPFHYSPDRADKKPLLFSWYSWSKNCSSVSFNKFPESIPEGVAIPHYAYLNPLINGSFNFLTAMNDTGAYWNRSTRLFNGMTMVIGADVFGPPMHSHTSHILSPYATSAAPQTSGTVASHAGAIAGGVVGGLALLGVFAVLLIYFCILMPRDRRAKSGAHKEAVHSLAEGSVSHPMSLRFSLFIDSIRPCRTRRPHPHFLLQRRW